MPIAEARGEEERGEEERDSAFTQSTSEVSVSSSSEDTNSAAEIEGRVWRQGKRNSFTKKELVDVITQAAHARRNSSTNTSRDTDDRKTLP